MERKANLVLVAIVSVLATLLLRPLLTPSAIAQLNNQTDNQNQSMIFYKNPAGSNQLIIRDGNQVFLFEIRNMLVNGVDTYRLIRLDVQKL